MPDNHLLALEEGVLMTRINLEDVNGFFSKEVEITPGFRVIVFENGVNLGELGPGRYTLQTFADRLNFWSRAKATLYIFRGTAFSTLYRSKTFPTKDGFTVEVSAEAHFQFTYPLMLIRNLVAAADRYTLDEFRSDTESAVEAALRLAFSQLSIEELYQPEQKKYLDAAMDAAISTGFSRYGIKFDALFLRSIAHPGYDRVRQSREDLRTAQTEFAEEKAHDIHAAEKRFYDIQQQEKENEFLILEQQVQGDYAQGRLDLQRREFGFSRERRELFQSEEFDKIATQEEMEQFLLEKRKAGILRDAEYSELSAELSKNISDKEKRRTAALRILDARLEKEYQELLAESVFQAKKAALDYDCQIAQRLDTEENRRWLLQLERERAERGENIVRIENDRRVRSLEKEIALDEQLAQQRIQSVRLEMEAAEENNKLGLERRREEWQIELRSKKWSSELEERQAMQEMYHADDLFYYNLMERKKRLAAELDAASRSQNQKFELDKMRQLKEFGANGLLGVLSPEQGANLVQLQQTDSDRIRFEERLRATEESRRTSDLQSARIESLFRDTLSSQERTQDRMVQMHGSTPPPVIIPTSEGTVAGAPIHRGRVMICSHCRAEVADNCKFCPNCGTQF